MENQTNKTFDVNRVVVKDMDGGIIPLPIAKYLGNFIYVSTNTLEWLSISQAIHQSKPIEISETGLTTLNSLVKSDQCPLTNPCKDAIENYIKSLITKSK